MKGIGSKGVNEAIEKLLSNPKVVDLIEKGWQSRFITNEGVNNWVEETWVEKENSYPNKIIIERLAEGFGRSNQFWSEAYIKHWNKKAERIVLKDIDYEKILKILSKYENK